MSDTDSTTNTTTRLGNGVETVTWLVVSQFDAPVDLNDDDLLNAVASAIAAAGGDSEDSIIGNLAGEANGSLDSAYDAARGYLTAAVSR